MYVIEVFCEDIDWIKLASKRVQRHAAVNTTMIFQETRANIRLSIIIAIYRVIKINLKPT